MKNITLISHGAICRYSPQFYKEPHKPYSDHFSKKRQVSFSRKTVSLKSEPYDSNKLIAFFFLLILFVNEFTCIKREVDTRRVYSVVRKDNHTSKSVFGPILARAEELPVSHPWLMMCKNNRTDAKNNVEFSSVTEIERFRGKGGRRIIQVTGRPASGKSTIAKYLAEHCGYYVVSMDDVVLKKPSKRLQDRMKAIFGSDIYSEEGGINIKKILQNIELFPQYVKVAVPEAEPEIAGRILNAFQNGYRSVVIDFVFPMELVSSLRCDQVIFIDRQEETRSQSVLDRPENRKARSLIAKLMPVLPSAEEYSRSFTYTILNNGSLTDFYESMDRAIDSSKNRFCIKT